MPASSEQDAEPVRLAIKITPQDYAIQALPVSWDTATLRLTHPTKLVQARTATLTKGTTLVSNGSGGYVASGTFGTSLRPGNGYVLTVCLWNGGAYTTLAGEKQLTLNLVAGVNAVTVPIEVYPALALTSFSPTAGIPGDSLTLSGTAFSVLPFQNNVLLGTGTASLTTTASQSITTTIPTTPDLAPNSYTWVVTVGTSVATRAGFNVLGTVGAVARVTPTTSLQQDAALDFGANQYLVAWVDSGGANILARRVTSAGTQTDGDIALTSTDSSTRSAPAVAYSSNNNNFMVVWSQQTGSTTSELNGGFINASGNVQMQTFQLSSPAGQTKARPAVAHASSNFQFMVVWSDNRNGAPNIYAQRVAGSGNLQGSTFGVASVAATQDNPVIAYNSNGDQHLVAWEESVGSGFSKIRARLVGANSTLGAGPFDVSANGLANQAQPSVAAKTTDGSFLVVWISQESPQKVMGQLVSSAGTLAGSPFTISSATGTKAWPRVRYESWRDKFVTVWADNRNASTDIYGQFVDSSGSLWGTVVPVATTSDSESQPTLAIDGTNQRGLVVFKALTSGTPLLFGQRVR